MKVKFGVLVGCVLCALSVACLGFLSRFEKSKDSWTPEDVYMQVGGSSYSTVSSGASSSDDVLVSMRGMSRMSRRVSAPSFSHAPSTGMSSVGAGVGSTYPSLQGGAGVGSVYTTSSAQFHSFGGGNNVGMSMSNGAVQSSVGSAAGLGVSMQSTSAYALAANSSSLAVSDVMSVTGGFAMTSSYQGIGGVAGPRGIGGRQEAPPSYGGDGGWGSTWLNWLDNKYGNEGSRGFTWSELGGLYDEWCEEYCKNNPGVTPPSIDEWYAWFYGSDGSATHTGGVYGNTFHFIPVGNVLPLLLMALMYICVMVIRQRRISKQNIED